MRTGSQSVGHARISKTEGAIESVNIVVAAGYPKRDLGLPRGTYEVEALLNERAANAASPELGVHPHSAEKGGFRRGVALHKDHADRVGASDRDEDCSIVKVGAIDSAGWPVGSTRVFQGLAKSIGRVFQGGESDSTKKVDVLRTKASHNDFNPSFRFPGDHLFARPT